jgi:hypothetical protein
MRTSSSNEIETCVCLVANGIDLTTTQAAIYLNLSPRTLEKYRITGEGPHFYRYGRAVRYSINDLSPRRATGHCLRNT